MMTSPRRRSKLTRIAILALLTVIGMGVFYGCSVLDRLDRAQQTAMSFMIQLSEGIEESIEKIIGV